MKIIIFTNDGKMYALNPSVLPSGKSNGRNFSFFVNINRHLKIIVIYKYNKNLRTLLVSYKSKGFILNMEDIPSLQKNGKQVFNIKNYDIIICTSCEHLKQELIDNMIVGIKSGALVILQSNNYLEVEGHINCHNSVIEFEKSLRLEKILYRGTLKLNKFDRYMVIGI